MNCGYQAQDVSIKTCAYIYEWMWEGGGMEKGTALLKYPIHYAINGDSEGGAVGIYVVPAVEGDCTKQNNIPD